MFRVTLLLLNFLLFFWIHPNLLFSVDSNYEKKVLSQLELIPSQDLKWIKLLFQDTLINSELAYTLFGEKPFSFYFPAYSSVDGSTISLFSSVCFFDKNERPFSKGAKKWEKYSALFNTPNYALFFDIYEEQLCTIYLINRKEFKKIAEEHISLVRSVYGKDLTSTTFLKKVEDREIDLIHPVKHHGLLGLLLGFGKENSGLFQRRQEIEPQWTETACATCIDGSFIHSQEPLQEELDYINKKLQGSSEIGMEIDILYIPQVMFVADLESYETKLLKEKYHETSQKIQTIFEGEDWFTQVILQLTSI